MPKINYERDPLSYPIVLDEHLNKIHCSVAFSKKIIIFQGNLLVTLPII
jgi:hypothetical protein